MAALLVIGAIPSGLAGTISSAQGLYVVRFFIGTSSSSTNLNRRKRNLGQAFSVVRSYRAKHGLRRSSTSASWDARTRLQAGGVTQGEDSPSSSWSPSTTDSLQTTCQSMQHGEVLDASSQNVLTH